MKRKKILAISIVCVLLVGGGSVGGLVGMTNMDITNCSAVTDIIINIGYNGAYQNLRVGGIAGVSRGAVRYCYAGGSMRSTAKF